MGFVDNIIAISLITLSTISSGAMALIQNTLEKDVEEFSPVVTQQPMPPVKTKKRKPKRKNRK